MQLSAYMFTERLIVVVVVLLTYLANGIGGHCDDAVNSKGI